MQLGTQGQDIGTCLAADPQGYLYLAGSTQGAFGGINLGGLDAFVARLDPNAGPLWVRQMGGSGQDEAVGVGVDSAGNVYVAGNSSESPSGMAAIMRRAWVSKYSASGDQLWMQELGAGEAVRVRGLAIAASGGGTVVGESNTGGHGGTPVSMLDMLVVNFNADGMFARAATLGTAGSDRATSVARGGQSLYVSGSTSGSFGSEPNAGGDDLLLVKVEQGTDQGIWAHQLGSSEPDEAARIAVDGAENVTLVGSVGASLEDLFTAGDDDVVVARYGPDGQRMWLRQIGTAQGDQGLDAVPVAAGELYVVGSTSGALAGAHAGAADAFILKLGADGGDVWRRQLGGRGADIARAAAVDGEGTLHVLINSESDWDGSPSSGGLDIVLLRFTADGERF